MTALEMPKLVDIALSPEEERRALGLHREAIVVDGSLTLKQDQKHFDDARAGGVTATNHTVCWPNRDLPTSLQEVNSCRRWIDGNSNEVLLATTVADIVRAKESGREAIILGPRIPR